MFGFVRDDKFVVNDKHLWLGPQWETFYLYNYCVEAKSLMMDYIFLHGFPKDSKTWNMLVSIILWRTNVWQFNSAHGFLAPSTIVLLTVQLFYMILVLITGLNTTLNWSHFIHCTHTFSKLSSFPLSAVQVGDVKTGTASLLGWVSVATIVVLNYPYMIFQKLSMSSFLLQNNWIFNRRFMCNFILVS